jgi:hypothetical protein
MDELDHEFKEKLKAYQNLSYTNEATASLLAYRWGDQWWETFGLKECPNRNVLLHVRKISHRKGLVEAAHLVTTAEHKNPTWLNIPGEIHFQQVAKSLEIRDTGKQIQTEAVLQEMVLLADSVNPEMSRNIANITRTSASCNAEAPSLQLNRDVNQVQAARILGSMRSGVPASQDATLDPGSQIEMLPTMPTPRLDSNKMTLPPSLSTCNLTSAGAVRTTTSRSDHSPTTSRTLRSSEKETTSVSCSTTTGPRMGHNEISSQPSRLTRGVIPADSLKMLESSTNADEVSSQALRTTANRISAKPIRICLCAPVGVVPGPLATTSQMAATSRTAATSQVVGKRRRGLAQVEDNSERHERHERCETGSNEEESGGEEGSEYQDLENEDWDN